MNKKILIIALLLALVAGLAYWWKSKNHQNSTEKEVVKIGVILPLTGEAAAYGKAAQNGLNLALSEVNKDSKKIELIYEDSQGDPKKAITAFQSLLAIHKISSVIGPISSPEVIAVAPIAEKNKVVLLSTGASSPEISKLGDYIFRNVPSDIYEPTVMAQFLAEKNYKKIVIAYVNNDYGVGVRDVFTDEIKKLTNLNVEQVAFARDAKSFKAEVSKIRSVNPDAIYLIGYKELATLLRQIKEENISAPLFSNSLFEDPEILKNAGNAANGVIFTTFPFDVASKDANVSHFVDSYKANYHQIPDGFAAVSYEAIHLINIALAGSGNTTNEKIKNGLYSIHNYKGLIGEISFDKNGDVVFPIKLKKVENNQFINY